MPTSVDPKLLEAALVGLHYKLADIDRRMADLRSELSAAQAASPMPADRKAVRRRRPMSEATKRRMAVAQRKRWKQYHAAMKQA